MKKIFTLILGVGACLSVSAQESMQLLFGPDLTPVQAGQTYETKYTVDASGVMYTQDAELALKCEEGYDITVVVKASSSVQVCSIDGFCVSGSEVTKTGNSAEIPAADIVWSEGDMLAANLRIDKVSLTPDDIADITIEVTAYYNDAPDTKVSAKVVMTNQAAGIGAISADTYYVKACTGNTINYRLQQPATISIYAITGNLVAKYPANGTGSINLSGLRRGIYLYSDGRHSGKITIR